MLPYRDPNTLTQILKRLADKAGVKYADKVVRFHCLRKFLIDRLKNVMPSESAWKQVVGKKIAESAYVSEEGLRDGYVKAMAETCFTKMVTEAERQKMSKKQALMVLLDMTEEDLKRIARAEKKKITTIDEEIAVLEELRKKEKQRTATNGGCQNGNCQRIVSEEELPSLLAEGWLVSAVLPSGKVVVSNETLS